MVSLAGKVALVTGGSVGKELARGFLRAGANVAFIYRNPDRKAELDKTFSDFSAVYESFQADLADASQARKAVMSVEERFGGVDFLLNSLGGWVGGRKLHEHSPADLGKMLSIDLVPTFNIMSAVIPAMVEEKFGRIINFVSMQVFGSGAGSSVYAASAPFIHFLLFSVSMVEGAIANTEMPESLYSSAAALERARTADFEAA